MLFFFKEADIEPKNISFYSFVHLDFITLMKAFIIKIHIIRVISVKHVNESLFEYIVFISL